MELKPCPFCGGEAGIIRYGNGRQSSIIACIECGCELESNESGWNTGDAWNKRVAQTDNSGEGGNVMSGMWK